MKTLEEQYLEKLNLETCCLEKLNIILFKFNLQIVVIKVNQLNQRQYRLVYKNNTADWLVLWLSISDMLFACTTRTIFDFLNSYYTVMSNPSFDLPDIPSFNQLDMDMYNDTLSRYQDCSDAYKEILPLKSNSLEEFLIKCNLMGA
jgi:hypothetical protein